MRACALLPPTPLPPSSKPHLFLLPPRRYASDVYEASCKKTGKKVALKVYSVEQVGEH